MSYWKQQLVKEIKMKEPQQQIDLFMPSLSSLTYGHKNENGYFGYVITKCINVFMSWYYYAK